MRQEMNGERQEEERGEKQEETWAPGGAAAGRFAI